MNNDELKTLKTEFDTELKRDKRYHKIAQKVSALIRTIPSELKHIAQRDNIQSTRLLSRLKITSNKHKQLEDNYHRSMKAINLKNEHELRKIKNQSKLKLDKITKTFNASSTDIQKERDHIEHQYEQSLKDIKTTYQRDIDAYEKVSLSARKLNQKVTLEIEKEQQEALEGLKNTHEKTVQARQQSKQILVANYEKNKKDIDEHQASTTTLNNDIYLAIKTNYNECSVIFNKKINELNKENQKALKTIKDQYETKCKPVHDLLNKLKDDYKQAISNVKSSYKDELIKMNEVFDEKKASYEQKKERIIHESNEMISLLNSKLTAYKDAVNHENVTSAREIRSKMKTTEDTHEQVELQKTLRANLKNTNTELNKQIIRTNKEINVKQRDFHYRLYHHDLLYLKTINDWRLEKSIATYRHKQSIAKIDLNFNHNIAQSKAQLALYEAIYKHQEELLNLSLNKDLLSLEAQLQIASIMQERELNLLTNDQQVSLNETKLAQAKLELDYQLALEDLDFEQKKDELTYSYNQLTVGSNTQLELEKARNRRDFSIQEQNIRSDIAKKIYDHGSHKLNLEKQATLLDIDYTYKHLQLTHDNDAFHIDLEQRKHIHKHVSFMMQAATKNQRRISLSKIRHIKSIDHHELMDTQYHIHQLTAYLLTLHHKRLLMRQLIHELYLLPSHPDTFKQSLLLAMRFDHEIDRMMHDYIKQYEVMIRDYFKSKIENPSKFRCVMKHDQMQDFYHAKIERLDRKQQLFENDIQNIEQQYIKFQSDITQNEAFIEQLTNINEKIKSGLLPLQTSYDYKENIKLIKNHVVVISHLKNNMKRSGYLINLKRKEINRLTKEKTAIQKDMENETKHLVKHKANESQFYLKHLVKHDKHFKVINKKLSNYTQHSLAFYSDLRHLVYVTDDSIKNAFKKLNTAKLQFEKQLITAEQRLLGDMLSYHKACVAIETAHSVSFHNITSSYLHQIDVSNRAFINNQQQSLQIQKMMVEKQSKAILRDKTHQQEILKLNKQKATHTDLNDIKQLEQDLDTHLMHSKEELDALNENQRAIAMQYIKEVEQKMEGHKKEHLRHINFFKTRFENTSKDLDSSNQALANKDHVLLLRYDTQRIKVIETMKNKHANYALQINTHQATIHKAIDTHKKNVTLKDKHRQDELQNIQNHFKRFKTHAETSQKNTFNKETTSLKRNLSFKLKALKLN